MAKHEWWPAFGTRQLVRALWRPDRRVPWRNSNSIRSSFREGRGGAHGVSAPQEKGRPEFRPVARQGEIASGCAAVAGESLGIARRARENAVINSAEVVVGVSRRDQGQPGDEALRGFRLSRRNAHCQFGPLLQESFMPRLLVSEATPLYPSRVRSWSCL